MKRVLRMSFAAMAIVALATPVAGQTKVPKTPWGHPDLQGVWSDITSTPFERPKSAQGREFLTDAEVAELQRAAKDQYAQGQRGNPAARGSGPIRLAGGNSLADNREVDSADLAARAPAGDDDPVAVAERTIGTYNSFWTAESSPRNVWRRTSLVVDPPDGKLPPFTREFLDAWEAKIDARDKTARGEADSYLDRSLWERCLTTPSLEHEMIFSNPSHGIFKQILQTPQYVVIFVEVFNDVRIIPLDGRPHVGKQLDSFSGDSRGRWEGDTLVVETTNFRDRNPPLLPSHGGLTGMAHRHAYPGTGETLKMTERFRRVDADTIEYSYTMDDPKVFVRPYTVMLPLWKDRNAQEGINEYACHEGNYGLSNLLSGARANEEDARKNAIGEQTTRRKELQAERAKLEAWEKAHK